MAKLIQAWHKLNVWQEIRYDGSTDGIDSECELWGLFDDEVIRRYDDRKEEWIEVDIPTEFNE